MGLLFCCLLVIVVKPVSFDIPAYYWLTQQSKDTRRVTNVPLSGWSLFLKSFLTLDFHGDFCPYVRSDFALPRVFRHDLIHDLRDGTGDTPQWEEERTVNRPSNEGPPELCFYDSSTHTDPRLYPSTSLLYSCFFSDVWLYTWGKSRFLQRRSEYWMSVHKPNRETPFDRLSFPGN